MLINFSILGGAHLLAWYSQGDIARWESLLIWTAVLAMCGGIVIAHVGKHRRKERKNLYGKREAVELKLDQPPAQHPMVDTSLCIGCGSCVDACPEGGVLGLINGKATIINGLRCVGHGRCAEACPVEAVTIGLGDLSTREDIPQTDNQHQTNIPGLYIAGELGGLALVKNAVHQATKVVHAIASEMKPGGVDEIEDLVVVGAGPAGLSAALAAKEKGFSCLILEQEAAGGTILQYPRKKMMLTQPVEIPLYGWLKRPQYAKEELLAIWHRIIESQELRISRGEILDNVLPDPAGFEVVTSKGRYRARRVILALGRRGTPRKLGAPGEDRAKVMYKLIDAGQYSGDHLLLVGGGDSAVEAAVALSRQAGNTVTISYRKHKFFRIKKRNLEALDEAVANGSIRVIYNSNVVSIDELAVLLKTETGDLDLRNDFVFIFAGGIPPFGLLKKIGIAFGGEHEPEPQLERAG